MASVPARCRSPTSSGVYGRSAMAEVIEADVRDANNQIVSERGSSSPSDPKVTLPSEQDVVES